MTADKPAYAGDMLSPRASPRALGDREFIQSSHEDRGQARVAGDSMLVAIVLAPKTLPVAPYAGYEWANQTIHPHHGPKTHGFALGFTLSPTTWATLPLKCLAICRESHFDHTPGLFAHCCPCSLVGESVASWR